MGKKRVTNNLNDDNKPPNHVINDYHHRHHHRHHNHQKPKKIKPEARLLHTLNSHFKKLAKYRSKKVISLSSPRANDSPKDNKHHNGHLSCWLKLDDNNDLHNGFMGSDFGHDDAYHDDGGYIDQEVCLKTTSSFLEMENNEDLFGGACVFSPDISASHNMMVVFEEYGSGFGSGSGSGSYILDPVVNLDNGDEGKYLYEVLELSSQEDMVNQFLRVNLFGS